MRNKPGKPLTSTACKSSRLQCKAPFSNHSASSTIPLNNPPAARPHQRSGNMQSCSSPCMRRVSSAMLLLALLAAAAASVSARTSRQLLGGKSGDFSSLIDSKHAAIEAVLSAKAEELHQKKQKLHTGKTQLPLAIHMDQQIPAAMPNPSNPPMILANPSQPPVLLPATEVKHSKHDKKVKHAKPAKFDFESTFDHKFDHEDLLQLPVPAIMTSLPNPSQPPMPLPASTKHDKKALKMHLKLAAKLVKPCDDDKFDHDKKDKHSKFAHTIPAAVNAPLSLPNPSNPPMILANPSQPPVLLPATEVKHSKHDKKVKHAKPAKFDFESTFDHKFDHEDLLQLPVPAIMTSLPNPSQPPMPLPASSKLSKHDKKALKMHLKLASKLVKPCDEFDHDKKDKHAKFAHTIPAAVNAPLSLPNPSNPPMILANPSQSPVLLPAAHVKAGKLSKHEKKALKAAAKLAKAHGVHIDKAAGVSVADVVMSKEPKFEGPSLLG